MAHQLTTEDDPLAPARIREARERLGLSRRELGERLNPPTPDRTIAHWEGGDYRPKSPRREALAEVLGIDLQGTGRSGVSKDELVRSLLAMRTMIDDLIARA